MARSNMIKSYAQVPKAKLPRSSFNRSHSYKTTMDCDYLVPFYVDEVIPGSTFRMTATPLIRLNSPTLHPLMDSLRATIHWFFTPYRILWENWERMHGSQDDPGDSIAFTVPVLSTGGQTVAAGDLGDYMGLPYGMDPHGHSVSALPFRAYHKIWNEWYRDENLQDQIPAGGVPTDDGPDNQSLSNFDEVPLKRGKRYDYFTSSLPSPQKGTAVSIPLGTIADVVGDGSNPLFTAPGVSSTTLQNNLTGGNVETPGSPTSTGAMGWDDPHLQADLSTATAATINELRLAFQTQRLLERDARSGTRYVEHLAAHFGIDNYPDARLQRPEFLGGSNIPININQIANTSADGTQEQGELTGFGIGQGSSGFTKSFVEWGVIIGLISIQGDITYSQGLDRMWNRSTRYDFAYPVLSQVGEEAVLDKEIYFNAGDGQNDDVWGYQPRYESYRFKNSRNTGLMSVDAASSLSSWHLQEDFASRPSLDDTFIQSNTATPLDRAIAIPSEPQFNVDIYLDLQCALPLPLYGVPGNLDHL